MSTLSDIYQGMDQSYQTPEYEAAAIQDIKQNELPKIAAPVAPIDHDQEYKDWQTKNPNGGIYQYLYSKYAQKPEELDPKVAKARKTMATLTDVGSLFAEGLTAGLGGKVSRRDTNATATNNEALDKIRERYDANKKVYQDGLLRYAAMDKSAAAETAKSDKDFGRTLKLDEQRNKFTADRDKMLNAYDTQKNIDQNKARLAEIGATQTWEEKQTDKKLSHDTKEADNQRKHQATMAETDNKFRATEGDKSRATDEKVAGMRTTASNPYNFTGQGAGTTKPIDPNKYKVGGTTPSAVVGFDPNKYKTTK